MDTAQQIVTQLAQGDFAAVAQTLKQPMLFLLGGSDYQVTREDFQIWRRLANAKEGVSNDYL